ncbi:MAG: SGNH/GDSL hydrolase family protein [Faecalibacterium prausnitzii]
MSQKRQQQNETMTPMQHRAVLVCILCVLAVLLTFGITTTLLKKGGEDPAPSVSESAADPTPGEDLSGHYQIDNASTALLTETADAGTDYLNDTLFLGDSNTVRLYNNGLISLQQFCAKEGIGTQVALNEGIVTFKKDSNHYTIPQAVAMMKPRRVVMTFGTNDTGMEVPDFIAHYTALIQAIQQSYPYTDIIVNTVPPVPADHSNYPHMDQAKIDDFNMALLDLCEQLGVRFPQLRRGPQGQRRLRHRGLLHQRRHPPQERRPQGSAELSPHPRPADRGPPPRHQQHPHPHHGVCLQPQLRRGRSQLGGCQLQRESGRERQQLGELFQREHQRGQKVRGSLPCGQERRRHSERRQ